MEENAAEERVRRKKEFEKLRAEFTKEAQQRASAQVLAALDRMSISVEAQRQYLRDVAQAAKAGEDAARKKPGWTDPMKYPLKVSYAIWKKRHQELSDRIDPDSRLRNASKRDAKKIFDAALENLESRHFVPSFGPASNDPVMNMSLGELFGPNCIPRQSRKKATPAQAAQESLKHWEVANEERLRSPSVDQMVHDGVVGNTAFGDVQKSKKNGKEPRDPSYG